METEYSPDFTVSYDFLLVFHFFSTTNIQIQIYCTTLALQLFKAASVLIKLEMRGRAYRVAREA